MTNLEYIKGKVGANYPIGEATFENAIIASGLDPNEQYVPGKSFDLAFIDVLMTLIASAKRISEGGYTVELDLKALNDLLTFYLRKWGLPDPSNPIIRGRRATRLW